MIICKYRFFYNSESNYFFIFYEQIFNIIKFIYLDYYIALLLVNFIL